MPLARPASLIYLVSLAVISVNALLWPIDGSGFVSGSKVGGEGRLFYCRDLMSSGGDDDAMVFALIIFALPLILRIARRQKPPSRIEIWLYGACWLCALLVFYLTTLDCVNLAATVLRDHDLQLTTILVAMAVNLSSSFSVFRWVG